MVDGNGGLRQHWQGLIGSFSGLGQGGLAERAARLQRAFEEEGVTTVLPGASAADHAWRCDPVPLLITAAEFAELEAGLIQRARLLEAVLADLYGRQSLLADGTLPPSLVYPNPGFLRACCGMNQSSHLQFYAADLVRGPDGAWCVLADRTGSGAGPGFARENRRMLSRVMPEAFRPMQVRQLRPFFDFWQDGLHKLAPDRRLMTQSQGQTTWNGQGQSQFQSQSQSNLGPIQHGGTTVALLTEGTGSVQWFEHLYLSRELSCALVEGGDLTVRHGVVFLKTLRGLKQVDVLLRRIDGRMVDPLELDQRSHIGVPGLMDAARSGAIRITNDPGSGAAEAPALAAFLPQLCRRLLGEELMLPSIPSIWLGEERSRARLAQNPNAWLIRPATDGQAHAQPLATMPPADRALLMRRIEQRPWEYVASAAVPPSVAPCLVGEHLAPLPVSLRLFLTQDQGEWLAMQGGLGRVLEPGTQLAGSLPMGGLSKDVWVLNDERGDITGPPPLAAPILRIRRTSGDLPSRVADNLFWLGRYVERLERSARLIRATVTRLARGTRLTPRELSELQSLARCLAEAGCVPPDFARGASASLVLTDALLACTRENGALMRQFASISQLTESVRDRLTGDMYATFTQALRAAREDVQQVGRSLDGLSHAMVAIQRYSTAVAGVAAESMVRGGGWIFLDLGRRIERAHAVATEIAIALDQTPPRIETGLRLALELCDSAISYRTRYLNVLQPAPVLDLVLVDQGNPRGLAFQLVAIHSLLDELAEDGGRELFAGVAAGLLAEIEALVEGVMASRDQSQAASDLPPQLEQISANLAELSDRITRRYFALLPVARSFGAGDEEEADASETGVDAEELLGVS